MTATLDFTSAEIPCFSVKVALESFETVDPGIAMRSHASIYRVTRRLHSTFSENTLFARRVVFSPTIPANGTPEFVTSGVSLEWRLKIEFTTTRLANQSPDDGDTDHALLEEVVEDERGGTLSAAVDLIPSEAFEISIPLRVYGTVGEGSDTSDPEGYVV